MLVCGMPAAEVGATARELARAGFLVILSSAENASPHPLVEEIRARGGRALALDEGLTSAAAIDRLSSSLRQIGRLWGLSCHVAPPERVPWSALDAARWRDERARSLARPFFLTKQLATLMADLGGGRVVQVFDRMESPRRGDALAGVVGPMLVTMTQALAKALAPRISVNAIARERAHATKRRRAASGVPAMVSFLMHESFSGTGRIFICE